MRAIVTGSEGFIGQHLVARLLDDNWYVTGIDDFSTHANPAHGHVHRNYTSLQISAQGYRLDSEGRRADVIFHLAGKVGPVGVLHHAGDIAADTVASADNIGNICKVLGIPMIDISTSEIYGSPDHTNAEDDVKMFRTASPRQEYAIAKLAAEVMLLNRKNLDVRIIRPFNVAGPLQRPEGGFVIPRFVRAAIQDKALTVYEPGTQERAFTHVVDLVDGIMLAYERGESKSIYNLGNIKNRISMIELAEEIIGAVGSGFVSIVNPKDLHGPEFNEAPEKLPDATKAMRELGWRPVYTLDDIIIDTIESER